MGEVRSGGLCGVFREMGIFRMLRVEQAITSTFCEEAQIIPDLYSKVVIRITLFRPIVRRVNSGCYSDIKDGRTKSLRSGVSLCFSHVFTRRDKTYLLRIGKPLINFLNVE